MRYIINTTSLFNKWFRAVKDKQIKFRIEARITRLKNGNFGDVKALGGDLNEVRFFFGGGIRLYYMLQDNEAIILLVGGDKSSQKKDIERAREVMLKLKKENEDG